MISDALDNSDLTLFFYQSGFRYNYSTNYTVIGLTEMISDALDNSDLTLPSHAILLSKLNHCSIRGVDFDWFKSYISDRTQFTTINNEISEIETMAKYGVSRG